MISLFTDLFAGDINYYSHFRARGLAKSPMPVQYTSRPLSDLPAIDKRTYAIMVMYYARYGAYNDPNSDDEGPIEINEDSTIKTTLAMGEKMYNGEYIRSPNGKIKFILQSDGNLVIYEQDQEYAPIWASNTDQPTTDENGNPRTYYVVYQDGKLR